MIKKLICFLWGCSFVQIQKGIPTKAECEKHNIHPSQSYQYSVKQTVLLSYCPRCGKRRD